jgi:hypothetical protein
MAEVSSQQLEVEVWPGEPFRPSQDSEPSQSASEVIFGFSGPAAEYMVQVQTGNAKGASDVDADFSIELVGSKLSSGPLRLRESDNDFRFVENQKDTFMFLLPHLGSIIGFRVWRNFSVRRRTSIGALCQQRWLLESAAVFDKGKRVKFSNVADGWITDAAVELQPDNLKQKAGNLGSAELSIQTVHLLSVHTGRDIDEFSWI